MSARTCYLHLGTGKTGSSAIQYSLARADSLLKANGYLYPDAARNFGDVLAGKPTTGNGTLVNAALHEGDLAGAIANIQPYADDPRHLILSCEGFANAPADALAGFASRLRSLGYVPKGLVFFRPQAEFFVSSYLQQIKAGRLGIPLHQYIHAQCANGAKSWLARTQKLEGALGEGFVTVRWYPAIRRQGPGALLREVFAWLGAPSLYEAVKFSANTTINPTPGQEALLVLQAVNAARLGGRRRFADKFLNMAEAQGLLGAKVELSASDAKRIHDATRADNELLLRRYCPDLSTEHELALFTREEAPRELDKELLQKLRAIAYDILTRGSPNPSVWWRARQLKTVSNLAGGYGELSDETRPYQRQPWPGAKGLRFSKLVRVLFAFPRLASQAGRIDSEGGFNDRIARRRGRAERLAMRSERLGWHSDLSAPTEEAKK